MKFTIDFGGGNTREYTLLDDIALAVGGGDILTVQLVHPDFGEVCKIGTSSVGPTFKVANNGGENPNAFVRKEWSNEMDCYVDINGKPVL